MAGGHATGNWGPLQAAEITKSQQNFSGLQREQCLAQLNGKTQLSCAGNNGESVSLRVYCATLQGSPKLLQASDGTSISYQHEEVVDYDEVSFLLQKVGSIKSLHIQQLHTGVRIHFDS